MRVLHLSNYYPGLHGHAGGAEQAMQWTIQLHAEAGIENLLLTTPAEFQTPVQPERFEVSTVESLLPRLQTVVEPVKWYALQLDPLALAGMARVIRSRRPDAIHVGNAQFLTLGLLPLLRRLGIPVVLSIYDYWLFCPLTTLIFREQTICGQAQGTGCLGCLPPVHRLGQRGLLRLRPAVMRTLMRSVSRFVVLSDSSRRIAEAHGVTPHRIRVIRLPRVSEPRPRPAPAPGQQVLLVGWQQWRKGLHVALSAWPLVLQRFPGARLHVVGGGVKFGEAYGRQLQALMQQHRLEQTVTLHGRVSDEQLDHRLERAAVLLIPEQWENMSPLILLRGMELGKAMVASRVGGIPEFVRHQQEGLLAHPRDPRAFADGVIRLLEDPTRGASLGAAAQQRVHQLCLPEATRQAWVDLYAGLSTDVHLPPQQPKISQS